MLSILSLTENLPYAYKKECNCIGTNHLCKTEKSFLNWWNRYFTTFYIDTAIWMLNFSTIIRHQHITVFHFTNGWRPTFSTSNIGKITSLSFLSLSLLTPKPMQTRLWNFFFSKDLSNVIIIRLDFLIIWIFLWTKQNLFALI